MYSTAGGQPPQRSCVCSQDHRSNLIIATAEGGSICLVCLSNLLTSPRSATVHVSYALSQLSQALFQPQFVRCLQEMHSHFLISPLVAVLSNFDDEAIARQTIELIRRICDGLVETVRKEFVSRVSDLLSCGSLAWSRRQLYMLHCFGVLLDNQDCDAYTSIKNKDALITNLVTGLQLSDDEIRGEIYFILYRLFLLYYTFVDDSATDGILMYCPQLLRMSLNILMKSQSDDVRLNCIAFLVVLTQRGVLQCSSTSNTAGIMNSFFAESFMQISEPEVNGSSLDVLFAEAIKVPLLSSDNQVQTATLDLLFLYLSGIKSSEKKLQVFIEQNIADYVFEVLRLSGSADPIVNSSIQVLDIFSLAEESFRTRLALGFSTLVSVLHNVAAIPFHPMQCQLLKLVLTCVLNSPGLASFSTSEEIGSILAGMLKDNISMLPEAFNLSCSLLVATMKCPSSHGNTSLAATVKDTLVSVISTCMGNAYANTDQILHSLYLLKEAYVYEQTDCSPATSNVGLRPFILEIFTTKVLPWFIKAVDEFEEDSLAMAFLETLNSLLVLNFDSHTKNLADYLVSSSWFSIAFGCLGSFPAVQIKWMIYMNFSSLIDILLGSGCGAPVKDAAHYLPSDPIDMLFLLGQKSNRDPDLLACQKAVLLVLYLSSLYDDRIADDKLALASLEQFILLNCGDFIREASNVVTREMIVNLYGLYRGLAEVSYQIPYSVEAEKKLFELLSEKDWDSLSSKIHLTSLRWLFRQEKLCRSLSDQVLKFCSRGSAVVSCHESSREVNLHVLTELIISGGNFVTFIFVCLLGDLVEEANRNHDIILVLKTCRSMISICPGAADHFCTHSIDAALHNILLFSIFSFPELFTAASQLVFSILKSVQSASLSDSEAWIGMSKKLMDYALSRAASNGWNEEVFTVVGILCLILHHSTAGVLQETSRMIILNPSLASSINSVVSNASSKGPALFDDNEGTITGRELVFVLFLVFFSLSSLRVVVPGIVDLQALLDDDEDVPPLRHVGIRCHVLCKLLHFGPPSVKLISSSCLVELFAWFSNYTDQESPEVKFEDGYLLSVKSVLEGLIFYDDPRVAMNCSKCLSHLLSMEGGRLSISGHGNWLRVMVDELVMYLCTPSVTWRYSSSSFKPALNVAVALLKLSEVPPWMVECFDDSRIGSIIENMNPRCLNAEMVVLFGRLMDVGVVNSAHVADLNKVFQGCRRYIYSDGCEVENAAAECDGEDQYSEVGSFLARIVSVSERREGVLEEIEVFMKRLA